MSDGTQGVFIRAPRILRHGPSVEVLARRAGDPVLVRAGAVLGACFHPELQRDHPAMQLFVDDVRRKIGNRSRAGAMKSRNWSRLGSVFSA